MLDKSKLEKEGLLLIEEIIRRHPDWLRYARNFPGEDSIFEIRIPPPVKENPRIEIISGSDGPYVYFGPSHFDFYSLRHLNKVPWFVWWTEMDTSLLADAIDKAVEKIVSEEFIAATWKSFLTTHTGFISQMRFSKYLEEGKVNIATSWRATYNYCYNGEWIYPDADE